MQEQSALGLVETYGILAAIEALDAACKCANIHSLSRTSIGGGIVTVMFRGDVASVKVAVDAAVCSASLIGEVLSSHVIPRVHEDVEFILSNEYSDEVNYSLDNKDGFGDGEDVKKDHIVTDGLFEEKHSNIEKNRTMVNEKKSSRKKKGHK